MLLLRAVSLLIPVWMRTCKDEAVVRPQAAGAPVRSMGTSTTGPKRDAPQSPPAPPLEHLHGAICWLPRACTTAQRTGNCRR